MQSIKKRSLKLKNRNLNLCILAVKIYLDPYFSHYLLSFMILMFVCLFVYFHQLSVTMNNNKVEGSNRDKTMKKQKLKEKFTLFDDDGAKVQYNNFK